MEIFGPGTDWTPERGTPGGVWCAQRIPDGEVGCSANRSRIGVVDLDDTDHFIASTNIFSLAEDLGFWKPGNPFIWHEVYGGPGDRYNSLREWRALSLVAPSLKLEPPSDPSVDRYPFSVKPDQPVSVEHLMAVMRDGYEGTEFDVTEHLSLQTEDGKSPLARPWGPPELFELLQIEPERAISTPTSGYVFIAQLRNSLPAAIANCLWFAYGPAATSCFVPFYAGVTDLPDTWDHPADFTRIDRRQPQWNFRLVHNLATNLRFQDAIKDIRTVLEPAEAKFRALQAEVEDAALQVFQKRGQQGVERLLTAYAGQCAREVGYAYHELVDYLTLRYLIGDRELDNQPLPRITPASIPDLPEEE
jgi:dipeptidase